MKNQSAHECHSAAAQKLARFAYRGMVEGARFENPTAPETIGTDLISSFQSQLVTEESAAGEKPINNDRAR